jgi:hypothetical protein
MSRKVAIATVLSVTPATMACVSVGSIGDAGPALSPGTATPFDSIIHPSSWMS